MAKKKIVARILCAALAASLVLSGCGQNGGQSSESAPSSQASQSSRENESSEASAEESSQPEESGTAENGIVFDEQGRFVKYDPPITLTTHAVVGVDTMFHEGCDIENNGWTQWLKENLGIEWKMKWVSADSENNTQKLDLAFASDDMPDVIYPSVGQTTKFAQAGKLTALDELLDNVPPIVQYYLDDAEALSQGAFWKPFTVDGKKYAVPAGMDSLAFWTDNFIRTDILAGLEMEIPETISDLDALFAAYHEKYPSGRAMRLDKDLGGWELVLTAYGANTAWTEKEGKLVYGGVQPEMRDALAKLAEYYSKGYIDPEFVVKDGSKANEDMIAGNMLVWNGAWSAIANPFTPMWNALPDAELKAIPFITGDDGTCSVVKDTWWTDRPTAITSGCEHPEAVFYAFGDNLDSYYRNEAGLRETLKNEYNYEMKYPVTQVQDPINAEEIAEKYPNVGQPRQLYLYEYSEEEEGCGYMNDYYTQQGSWLGIGAKIVSIGNGDFGTMTEAYNTGDRSVLSTDGGKMFDEWNSTHPNMVKTFAEGIYPYWDALMAGEGGVLKPNGYAGASTATMVEKQAYLDKLQIETFTQIIMGTQPIEAFDEFVNNWNANGGEDITAEVNEWYSSNK